jgi:hypothetical protein
MWMFLASLHASPTRSSERVVSYPRQIGMEIDTPSEMTEDISTRIYHLP